VSRAHLPLTEPPRAAHDLEPEPEREGGRQATLRAAPVPGPGGRLARFKPVEETAVLPQARIQASFEGRAAGRPGSPPVMAELPLRWPAQEAAGDAGLAPPWSYPAEERSPLPPASGPALAEVVQRQPAPVSLGSAVASDSTQVVQRLEVGEKEEGEPVTKGEDEPEMDLDDLARQVYPLIRRMLAVERERRPYR
jgi:hypothetical protein